MKVTQGHRQRYAIDRTWLTISDISLN